MADPKRRKLPREGFRRRVNPYYDGMNKRQIAADLGKTAAKWMVVTVLAYAYWFVLLMLLSIFLLNIWHVKFTQILIYSGILCAATSVVYGLAQVHRRFYY